MKDIVLFNPFSRSNTGEAAAKRIEAVLTGVEFEYVDMTKISDMDAFLEENKDAKRVILAGGDGTLNHFINDINLDKVPANIYYFANGSGNDFYNDVKDKEESEVFNLSKYLKHLPTVLVNGKQKLFINGVGYGIDGYCCEEADKLAKENKPVDYTKIAVTGLLFHYQPTDAKITVDGKVYEFKKVWLSPVMYGRYYGGGMIPCPSQDRVNKNELAVLVWFGSGRLKTLMNFSKIFKGEHLQNAKMCQMFTGKYIKVELSHPVAAQVDGETELNVEFIEGWINE